MVEQEYKWLVSREEFLRVLDKFSLCYPEQIILQKNYYYDTLDFTLFERRITLRVREKDKRFSMQIKSGQGTCNGYRFAEEKHIQIDKAPLKIPGSVLGFSNAEEYEMLGYLATKRHRFCLTESVRLDCDENDYFGVHDYELELEFQGEPPMDTLKQFQLFTPNSKSKYQRFLKEFRNEKKSSY